MEELRVDCAEFGVVVVDWLRLLPPSREKAEGAGAAVLGVAAAVDCPPRVEPKAANGDGRAG